MKNLTILFFGQLKTTWNNSQLQWQTSCDTIECLYAELLQTAADTPFKDSIKVAINDDFAQWQSPISDGDTIAFLPPASGG